MPDLDPNSTVLPRVELLRLAQGLGVIDADVMTRAELRAAIERASSDKERRLERPATDQSPVTWVSVARRLLASVVERGLNLPDAAALIRGDAKLMAPPKAPPPVATVTLARIYAAQGHLERAIGTLGEVLESDPDHELARDLRDQLEQRRSELALRENARAPQPVLEPQPTSDETDADSAPLESGLAAASEPLPRAPLDDVRPASDASGAPEPSSVMSVDSAAELVAPSFDTVDRQAAQADSPPFAGEPPTTVGVPPHTAGPYTLESPPPSGAVESEAAPTLAAGFDWQLGNDAAGSSGPLPEAWASSDTADASKAAADASKAAAAPANGPALPAPAAPEAPAAATPPPPLPSVPGLLLIETDTPIRYIYWELATAAPNSPHWIHVVTHTPTGRGGTERRERRFPVHRQLGALRLEGVPRQAVVRAKLTHAPDDDRALVVAGTVCPSPLGNDSFEVRYAPYAKAAPQALASRARPLLERASPVYWDS